MYVQNFIYFSILNLSNTNAQLDCDIFIILWIAIYLSFYVYDGYMICLILFCDKNESSSIFYFFFSFLRLPYSYIRKLTFFIHSVSYSLLRHKFKMLM